MIGDEEDLRQHLLGYFVRKFGTPDPDNESILAIYKATQNAVYPTHDGATLKHTKFQRYLEKKTRRALELMYPWLRLDPDIRAKQASYRRARQIDIIITGEEPTRGIVILRHAKVSGADEVLQWLNFTPVPADDDEEEEGSTLDANEAIEQLLTHDKPPLSVLLTHLWHFLGKVDGTTSARMFKLKIDPVSQESIPTLIRSAIPVSSVVEKLR